MENCGTGGMKDFTGSWKRGIWNSSTKSLPGYETYQLSPEVGMKHSEILTGLDLEQRMSIQFRSMIYKPRRMICNLNLCGEIHVNSELESDQLR